MSTLSIILRVVDSFSHKAQISFLHIFCIVAMFGNKGEFSEVTFEGLLGNDPNKQFPIIVWLE
jgi:hypothetical protein